MTSQIIEERAELEWEREREADSGDEVSGWTLKAWNKEKCHEKKRPTTEALFWQDLVT